MRVRAESALLPVFVGGAVLVLWGAAVRWSGTNVFPAPMEVIRGIRELWQREVLIQYIRDSLWRVSLAYAAAVLVGATLGMWMGWSRSIAAAINPVIQLLRPISPIAWIPVAIVLFGVGNLSAVFLVFLGALFPIVVTAQDSVASMPRIYLRVARNFGLAPVVTLWRVVLPAVLPRIVSGLRIALGIAWLVVVAAEMIAVDSGLGYLIIDARNAGKRYDLVVAGMLLIGMIGLMLDVLARHVESLESMRWGFRRE
jgi:NitT/TauT family transport system permease protein